MTSDRQISANRRNALRSTGPKTEAGRNRVSQNARKHGLNTEPPAALIVSFYRLIMDNPDANYDPLMADAVSQAAYHLAETEASLYRVRNSENLLLADWYEFETARIGDPARFRALCDEEHCNRMEAFDRSGIDWMEPGWRLNMLRKLTRYRNHAEVRRRKALRQWIEAQRQR